jgi:hypothetical protein
MTPNQQPQTPTDDTITENELDELVQELESENEEIIDADNEEPKKSSFVSNLFRSFQRDKINTRQLMITRFQTLAGIQVTTPVAKITVGNQTFDLKEMPKWYDVVRYKLCGIKFEIAPNYK